MADPAKLVQAEGASHMIAPFGPLNRCLAHGAHGYIFLVAVATHVYTLHLLLARKLGMVCVFAIETNLSGTDVTLDILNFVVLGDNLAFAVGLGAVSQ